MEWYFILLIVIGGLLALLCLAVVGLVIFGTRWPTYPNHRNYEEGIDYEVKLGRYTREEAEAVAKDFEKFTVKSPFNYELKCVRLLAGEKPSDKVVIIVHGIGCNLYQSIKFVPVFRPLGYDCILFDNRFHGESGGSCCTMSGKEKDDLIAVAKYVRDEMYPAGTKIGIQGESLGGATVTRALDSDFDFDFCVEDCGFRCAADQVSYLAANYVPKFAVKFISNLIIANIKRITGVDYNKVSALEAVKSPKGAATPMLFIHGEADDFVPFDNVKYLYEAKQGFKRLYTVPGAKHADSIVIDREKYKEKVKEFLDEIHA